MITGLSRHTRRRAVAALLAVAVPFSLADA
jgi:hypothetical protein